MPTKKIIVLMSLLVMVVLVAGCGPAQAATEAATNDERHQEAADEHNADESGDHGAEGIGHGEEGGGHEHVAAPHEYEDMRNPLVEDATALAAGQTIFQANCAMCHGPAGNGDGPAAEALDPKPASLADTAMMQDLSDGYLYWRISEGGQIEPFNSAMPAWKEGLSEQEIWQVVSYVRTLSDGHMDDAAVDEEHHEDGDDEHHE